MNKVFTVLLGFVILLAGCTKQNNIKLSTPDNDVIGYSVSSYIMVGAEQT
ncbi:MAG: hypothetical protein K0R09_3265 [Clostridiales bacterium]|jgi:hypothetical protein|nr:hypothetical protein [Clostridiales bacterium]